MKTFAMAVGTALLFWGGTPLFGTDTTFFDSDKTVAFRLEAPISTLKKQRGEEPEWLEGKVVWQSGDGGELRLDVKVKARGNFRRQATICTFPPYWLNFRKQQVEGSVFAGLDRIKVVAHCRTRNKAFERYIYKEYLVYK